MDNSSPPHPDQRYVEALLANDSVGIREIYERFAGRIAAFIRQNQGNTDDAKDVFQEALVAIAEKARGGNFVLTCPFEGFLYLVCRGKWLNELKKRQRQQVTIAELQGFSHVDDKEAAVLAETTLHQNEKLQLLWAKFEMLGDRCKEVIRLSWSGNGMEKVAELMGVTYAYVRKKKSECLARLVELVKGSPEFAVLLRYET